MIWIAWNATASVSPIESPTPPLGPSVGPPPDARASGLSSDDLRDYGLGADERSVAERKESLPPTEQGSLSGRMRDLILAQTVEERRKRQDGDDDAGSSEKRRRRDDHAANSADGDI
jgi:hypothetical protein